MDMIDWGMASIGIGFGLLLSVMSIVFGYWAIMELSKKYKKRKEYQIISVSEEFRDIWAEAVAIAKYEKNWEIIDKEKYRDRIDLHITRMLAMILD